MSRRAALVSWFGLGVIHCALHVLSAFVMMSGASHRMRFGGEMGWVEYMSSVLFQMLHFPLFFVLPILYDLLTSGSGEIALWMSLIQWAVIGLHSLAWAAIILLLGIAGWQRVTSGTDTAR